MDQLSMKSLKTIRFSILRLNFKIKTKRLQRKKLAVIWLEIIMTQLLNKFL